MKNIIILLMAVLFFLPTDAFSQSVIRRGQQPKKTTTRNQKNKKNVTTITKKRVRTTVTYGNYEVADSVAGDLEEGSTNTMTLRKMKSGVSLYGKTINDYVDNADAQTTVRDALKNCTNAKTGCLNDKSAIFVFGGNGYNSNGLPQGMTEALHYCNEKKYVVNDVAVTAVGWWCVVYNGYSYRGNLPIECDKALKKFMNRKETILSVSISEDGNYVIVTDSHYEASNNADVQILEAAIEKYGRIKSVCITNKGSMVICDGGIMYMNVPKNVIENLERQTIFPSVIRYTDSGTFIALDGNGGKAWYM